MKCFHADKIDPFSNDNAPNSRARGRINKWFDEKQNDVHFIAIRS